MDRGIKSALVFATNGVFVNPLTVNPSLLGYATSSASSKTRYLTVKRMATAGKAGHAVIVVPCMVLAPFFGENAFIQSTQYKNPGKRHGMVVSLAGNTVDILARIFRSVFGGKEFTANVMDCHIALVTKERAEEESPSKANLKSPLYKKKSKTFFSSSSSSNRSSNPSWTWTKEYDDKCEWLLMKTCVLLIYL
jgi:hypothetical protein